MTYLMALIIAMSTITAPVSASLPSYLTQVSTSPAPVVEAPQAPSDLDLEDTRDPAPRCEEDMPCWDCATMGNLQCGPIAEAPVCEEDMECWDCETMGNGQCGIDPSMEQDAYVSYDAQTGGQTIDDETALMLSYVATVPVEPTNLPANQFPIPSSNLEGVWHIMQWDATNHS